MPCGGLVSKGGRLKCEEVQGSCLRAQGRLASILSMPSQQRHGLPTRQGPNQAPQVGDLSSSTSA